jgi:hypothetical protein
MLINFRATSIWKAFILNAFAVSFIAIIAVESRRQVGKLTIDVLDISNASKELISFVATFIAAMIVYMAMYLAVGYGGGMLSSKK